MRRLLPLLVSTTALAAPPAGLTCLARHYGGTPVEREGAWRLELGKKVLEWRRAGRTAPANAVEAEARLDDPDLADIFEPAYRRGPITPITIETDDPGRTRVEALFAAAYPTKDLVRTTFFGHPVTLQRLLVAPLSRVEKRLAGNDKLREVFRELGGGYNDRAIAGTHRKSAHAYGIALDVNPAFSHYWRWHPGKWQNRIPQVVVDAFEAEGFIWGGRWYHFDTMHFEYRPELLDASCAPGEEHASGAEQPGR
jgi:hypothetical protein